MAAVFVPSPRLADAPCRWQASKPDFMFSQHSTHFLCQVRYADRPGPDLGAACNPLRFGRAERVLGGNFIEPGLFGDRVA